MLGLSPEAVKRLALRRAWPRRSDPLVGTQVSLPEALPAEEVDEQRRADEARDLDQGGARTLIDHLELRVEQLTEELAEARTELRGVRYEAESLRVDAGRAQVLMALIEAERGRSAEIKAERDVLAAELAWRGQPWFARILARWLARPDRAGVPFDARLPRT